MFSTCVPVQDTHTCCPWRSEEGIRSLELELQMVLSHYVGAGNRIQVPYESSSMLSQSLNCLSCPQFFLKRQLFYPCLRNKNVYILSLFTLYNLICLTEAPWSLTNKCTMGDLGGCDPPSLHSKCLSPWLVPLWLHWSHRSCVCESGLPCGPVTQGSPLIPYISILIAVTEAMGKCFFSSRF